MSQNTNDRARSDQGEMDTVIVEDPFLAQGFTQIPNAILRNPDISFGAKLTYSILLSYAWQKDSCFAGQEALAKDLGVKRWSVNQYLKELKDKKLIEVKRRGLGKTNLYYLPRLSEADVWKNTHQDVGNFHQQNVGKNTRKEYEGRKKTKSEEDEDTFRKGAALETQKKGGGEQSKETYSHIAATAIGNQKSRDKEKSSKGEAAKATTTRRQGNWKKAPLFIQGTIGDWFSPEMHDQAINSTITRVHRIYQQWAHNHPELTHEQLQDEFYQLMQTARTKAKYAKIKNLTPTGHPNRTPFFLACLADLSGVNL